MAIPKNKPLLDLLRQRGQINGATWGITDFELSFNLNEVASPDTQIFVLSPEVALAAQKLVLSPSFKLTDLSQLKFPYPRMAVEIPLTEEIKALRNPEENGTHPIKRLGLVIQSNHEDGWVNCSPYWEYEDPNLWECPLVSYAMGMDEMLPAPKVGLHIPQNISEITYFQILPSFCATNAFHRAGVPAHRFAELYRHPLFETYIRENISELPLLLFACNLMLNCKTGVRYTKIAAKDPPPGLSLGKHKKKRYSASAYTVMHLEEIENVDSDGNITQRTDIAAHYVRGHFKQRKHGLYWWNPFVRGKGEARKREAYIVQSGAHV